MKKIVKEMSLNREIYRITWPNIVTNISIPLLGIVDTAVMGHLDSTVYLGAVALGSMIFNIIYWSMSFLRMGTLGLTAQAWGKLDFKRAKQILVQGLIISVLTGIILILCRYLISDLSFFILDAGSELESTAGQYLLIRIWGAPATISLYVLTGWYLGTQNAKIPMYVAILTNVLNIILNLLFVLHFDMKSSGVALSTLISQYAGLSLGVFFLIRKYRKVLREKFVPAELKLKEFKKYLKVNIDIFIRTVSLLAVFTFFTGKSASYGETILAVNTVLMQFFYFFSYFIDGFANAAEALAGKYKGENNYKKIFMLINRLRKTGFLLSLLSSAIYLVFFKYIVRLLSSQQIVISGTDSFKVWVVLLPLISFQAFIWDGIYIGLTKTAAMRNNMLISAFLVFFPAFFISSHFISYHSLWLAISLFLLARGVTLEINYRKTFYRKYRGLNQVMNL